MPHWLWICLVIGLPAWVSLSVPLGVAVGMRLGRSGERYSATPPMGDEK